MLFNRTLQTAFIFSFATHIAIVAQNPGYLFFSTLVKSQKIEVNYVKSTVKEDQVPRNLIRTSSDPLLNLSSKIRMEKRNPPPFIERESVLRADMRTISRELPFDRPALSKPDIIAIKKKIILPQVDMGKIGNPSYINYYQVVREKIRRSAYQNFNRNETGEVYVTFVISSAGYLNEARLVEERTRASDYLKAIALASVKNASPFPRFPKELDYARLSFNVVISFEIE